MVSVYRSLLTPAISWVNLFNTRVADLFEEAHVVPATYDLQQCLTVSSVVPKMTRSVDTL